MPRESQANLLKNYRQKLSYSKRWREEEGYDDLWKRLVDLYRCKQFKVESDEDQILVNMAFATINVMGPAVSINHPKISVNARNPEDGDNAVVTESIVNYWWRKYGCQEEVRRAVKDFLIVGFGFVKTGYRFIEEAALDAPMPEFDSMDELVTPDETGEGDVETDLIIKEDRPFAERISPHDIYVDPDGKTMNDITWIAQCIKRKLADVKKDKRFNATARRDIAGSYASRYASQDTVRKGEDPEDTYVEIWEYYDIERNTISVFTDGGDKFLVAPTKMPFSFGQPFIMLRNYDVPEHFYPMGELEAIEPLQHELNGTRTQMMNHRKRYARKYLYDASMFDKDGIAALGSGEDNVMVPVAQGGNLQNAVVPMPALINPPEFYNQSELISGDIDRVSGVSEYARGGIPEGRRTATEAGIIQDNANARSAEKLSIIEKSIAEIARHIIMLAQQYLDGEHAIPILGAGQEKLWLKFERNYILGEFDFEVEAGSTAPVNESFKRQMAMQVVNAMAPFAQSGIIDMAKLAKYVLEEGFGIRGAESFIVQQAVGPDGQPMPPGPGGGPPAQGGPQGVGNIPIA